ncbi:hypothetical protein M947_06845 [Sulfurimonas hongkongensis]|uniref:Xanthine dehydrogenase n=1 Tax=Sulfurimonas hongkongensis TaxID=1172190 RepID=T0JEC9_9BACT|nr:xanthine dehydrogenase accessory protein XdhC [Sulfurimonas hongkongensis]EQB39370.1 hypothetical protein M947_06845 [Sulfurimonas hongkongensis]
MNLYKKIKKLGRDTSYVLVTIVDAQRSVPQEIGAKMLVTQECIDTPLYGTIGGGKIEKESLHYALSLLEDRNATSHLKHFCLTKDLDMVCGGEMTIFFEISRVKKWNIAIFGAGHIAQKLIRILKTLDCHIYSLDLRKEWLKKLPKSKNIMTGSFEHLLPQDCFCLIMTHSHDLDFSIAQKLLKSSQDIPYLGVIGSSSKAKSMKHRLKESGVSQEDISKIYSPVGLDIGNNTPEEIAISISAQLLEVRDSMSNTKL